MKKQKFIELLRKAYLSGVMEKELAVLLTVVFLAVAN
jgi:hypothetical protein|tara:strand:+ start:350 stop:460 length:111 start_codon:yes stop_codon:yes gene_type:complete